jgi:arylamine N-acetyltransferase
MSDVICAGAGTCRYQSTLLASVLSELGFTVRQTIYEYKNSAGLITSGHRWLEVDVPDVKEGKKTLVLDVTGNAGTDIIPLSDAVAEAQKPENRNSFSTLYYANPGRQYVLPATPH